MGKNKNINFNLLSKEHMILETLSKVQVVTIVISFILFIGLLGYSGFKVFSNDSLKNEITECETIVANSKYDEVQQLKTQLEQIKLSASSGTANLIPVLDMELTECLNIINGEKPSNITLKGIQGDIANNGEGNYTLTYESSSRSSVPGFLKKLQEQPLDFINVSTIKKSGKAWDFSLTIRVQGGKS